MVWVVGTWMLVIGLCTGLYWGWRINYTPKPNNQVELAKAIGEAIAKANGLDRVGIIDPPESVEIGLTGMWDTVREEEDPWMEMKELRIEE